MLHGVTPMACCQNPQIESEKGGESVCVTCGTVHEYTFLVQEYNESSQIVSFERDDPLVEQVCHTMHCEGLRPIVAHLVRQSKPLCAVKSNRNLVLACVYVAAKEQGYPFTLAQMGRVFGTSAFELGQVYKKIRKAIGLESPFLNEPEDFLESYCQAVAGSFGLCKQSLLDTSSQIVKLGTQGWLSEGRRVDIHTAAAITVAVGALKRSRPVPKVFDKAAEVSNCASTSIKTRHNELVSLLIETAHTFPHLMDVCRKNVYKYIQDVIESSIRRQLQYIKAQTPPPGEIPLSRHFPPSFQKNKKKRKELTERIERAEKRIKESYVTQTEQQEQPTELQDQDLLVEQLLLRGIPGNEILEMNMKKMQKDALN